MPTHAKLTKLSSKAAQAKRLIFLQRRIEQITGLTSRTESQWHSANGGHWSTEHRVSLRFTQSLDDMALAEWWMKTGPGKLEWGLWHRYHDYLIARCANGVSATAYERAEAFVQVVR